MILIKKGKEPESLTVYRKSPFAYYDGCNKEDIRRNLLEEQGCLCAYCMRRIRLNNTRIEHWIPESQLSEIGKLDYSNMLGVCSGHLQGSNGQNDTCDASKGNQSIVVDPRCAEHIATIYYNKGTGEIHSTDPQIENDIQHTLNLNSTIHFLPENRRAALYTVIQFLAQKYRRGNWSKTVIQNALRMYSNPNPQGEKMEYAGIIIWYLTRKIYKES